MSHSKHLEATIPRHIPFSLAPATIGHAPSKKIQFIKSDQSPQSSVLKTAMKSIQRRLISDVPSPKPVPSTFQQQNNAFHTRKTGNTRAPSLEVVFVDRKKDQKPLVPGIKKRVFQSKSRSQRPSPGDRSPASPKSPSESKGWKKSTLGLGEKAGNGGNRRVQRVNMQLDREAGVISSPKLYENQIFKDVFQVDGSHKKVLYSSEDEDPSLELYQVLEGPKRKGSKILFKPTNRLIQNPEYEPEPTPATAGLGAKAETGGKKKGGKVVAQGRILRKVRSLLSLEPFSPIERGRKSLSPIPHWDRQTSQF